jgi:hypothetical protein
VPVSRGSVWACSGLVLVLGASCGGRGQSGSRPDAAPDLAGDHAPPDHADAGADGGAAIDAGTGKGDAPQSDALAGGWGDGGSGASFIVMVTESPPGPDNGNRATWGGVRAYFVRRSGAALEPIEGIPAALLADPVGLTFRAASSEVFVSNRHGNNGADGVAGSIARFVFDPMTRALMPHGTITGNGLAGVHQAVFDPVSGELFAANVNGGVSRFTFDAAGNAIANGTIATGAARGVAISPDGKRLYVSGATPVIQQFALPAGTEAGRVSVSGANALLHYFAPRGNELYVSGFNDNTIYRLAIGAGNDLASAGTVTASNPVAVAFSADGLELFAVGHRDTHLIARFAAGAAAGAAGTAWTATTPVDVPFSGGGILVLRGGAPAVIGPPGSR